ncbi:MAG TPA: VWA domain-containing protein [Kofleriaceae bacterium]|nr:VWA domain-containing protein [Kofleriaceae bacterium]
MPTRQRIVTYGFTTAAAATITVALLLQPWRGDDEPVPEPPRPQPEPQPQPVAVKHPVDVVFAVDTTGSMGGLIEGAKRTVWSIATHIRKTDPDADVRIGLVAYRDLGDDYVTRDFALTSDLDAVFTELSGYRAAGGGDTPEDVDAALDDALHKMQWRDDARKLVFLVGDAPPASRGDVPTFDVLAREAGDRQIVLNTIRCGLDRDTEAAWQRIASLGHGQYSTIQQDGGVQQIATPYDQKLAELSAKIDSTAVIVGDDAERVEYHRNMAAAKAAPAAAQADRATYFTAKGAGMRAKKDIVDKVATGAADVDALATPELPAELRSMDKPTLKKELAKRVEERKAAEKELSTLAKERDEYLKNKARSGEGGFDDKVKSAIDEQLKR